MAAPHFQPHHHPQLVALMHRILERMQSDLLDALGLAITVHDKRHDEQPSVLAALGIGGGFAHAPVSGTGGPIPDAASPQGAGLGPHLWADHRWSGVAVAGGEGPAPPHAS